MSASPQSLLPATDEAAARLFHDAGENFHDLWSVAGSLPLLLHRLDITSADSAKQALEAVATGWLAQGVFPPETAALFQKHHEAIANQLAGSAKRAERIGWLTVAHAALETLLLDLLRVCARLGRADVLKSLSDRRVRLADVTAGTPASVEDIIIDQWLTERQRSPLLANWRVLFALAPPSPALLERDPPYDEDWLGTFDALRNDAVHNGGRVSGDVDVKGFHCRVGFMGWFLQRQVSERYAIPVPDTFTGTEEERAAAEALVAGMGAVYSLNETLIARGDPRASKS